MAEETIDQRLPYRVGFPNPLPVLPLFTAPGEVDDDRALQNAVRNILQEHGIRPYFTSTPLHFQYRYVQEPLLKSNVRQTALIECVYESPRAKPRWVEAATKIRRFLLNYSPPIQCRLELIDRVYEESRRMSPVFPTKHIAVMWQDGFRQRIIDKIQGRQWKKVELVHLTRIKYDGGRDGKTTIVIEATDVRENIWWDELLPEIRRMLPKGVELELRRWQQPWH
ncbi:hypothetical protein VTN77DRAFT_7355 [Rasamsonia byssochlamydoides]|uniref:uncharacterized protein n=1 Tax=Rasamsonia byssochlamydoides TaxID=89139 RepID=UPI0037427634